MSTKILYTEQRNELDSFQKFELTSAIIFTDFINCNVKSMKFPESILREVFNFLQPSFAFANLKCL